MALARVKSWNPGDILTASDLNAEYNNLLNNPISLVSPTTGAINFQTSVAHSNLQVSALTASSGFAGSVLITSTAVTPAPLWSTGATAGGVFVGTTAAIPTWSAASPLGGVFVSGTSGFPTWLAIGTSGQTLTVSTSGAPAWVGGAWTAYTPTLGAQGGTFTGTVTGASMTIQKLTNMTITITVTTSGTASGFLSATLPGKANSAAIISGAETANTGKSARGTISSGSTTMNIAFFDNTSLIAQTNVITMSGMYETT